MKAFTAALLLTTALATPAEARRGAIETTQDLHFIAETQIPGDNGMLSLCHLVEDMRTVFVTIHRTSQGYALAENRCEVESYYELDMASLKEAQGLGLIDPNIPLEPKISIGRTIGNFAWYGVMGVGVLTLMGGFFFRKDKKKRIAGHKISNAKREQLLAAITDVMCYVAFVDGQVDQTEIQTIADIYRKLTNTPIKKELLAAKFTQMPDKLDLAHLAEVFTGNEREILLHAAMMVAVADGRIDQAEYTFVCDLARAFDLSGDHIRAVLTQLLQEKNGTKNSSTPAGTPHPA